MFDERKVNVCEGVPLNSTSTGAANIFLNSGKNSKAKNDGTVIHLNTEKPAEVGVHINTTTTLSIASSKKIKLLFILNFLLSVLCMVISSSIAFYYWNEMISMRRQLETMRDQFLYQNVKDGHHDNIQQSALTSVGSPYKPERESRMDPSVDHSNAKRYYVEDLGEDMLLVDSSKKADKTDMPVLNLPILPKELLVVQFNGAMPELNLGEKTVIGPWERDVNVSSKASETKIELDAEREYVTIKESGLYLVYAQIVYLSRAPNCYYLFARLSSTAQLLSTCATGDNTSNKNLKQAQMSCSVQTVARFNAGDTVNLAQREPNQVLWLRPGNSYFGFIKLSS